MTDPFRLGVIIVNYRTAGLMADCLASLGQPGVLPSGTRVMVVEGGSGDDSARHIDEAIEANGWSRRVSLLPLDRNGGFAYANNRGLERLRAMHGEPEYVLFLNPDTVVRPAALTELLSFMDREPRVGIAGSQLEDMDGTRQACAFRFPSVVAELESEAQIGVISSLLRNWRIVPAVGDGPTQVDWVSGASMLVRSEVLRQVGVFDENFFLYYEEVDLCRRVAMAGWSCYHVPASRVVHLVGQATGVTLRSGPLPRRPAYWFKSRRLYFQKNHGAIYLAAADMAWVLGHLAFKIKQRMRHLPSGSPPHLLTDFIRYSLPNWRLTPS
jgi:GT2 family glycosyltransferase